MALLQLLCAGTVKRLCRTITPEEEGTMYSWYGFFTTWPHCICKTRISQWRMLSASPAQTVQINIFLQNLQWQRLHETGVDLPHKVGLRLGTTWHAWLLAEDWHADSSFTVFLSGHCPTEKVGSRSDEQDKKSTIFNWKHGRLTWWMTSVWVLSRVVTRPRYLRLWTRAHSAPYCIRLNVWDIAKLDLFPSKCKNKRSPCQLSRVLKNLPESRWFFWLQKV